MRPVVTLVEAEYDIDIYDTYDPNDDSDGSDIEDEPVTTGESE